MKHVKGFRSGFTELHAKLHADTLLNFAIHRRRNETQSRTSVKTMCVHSTESHGRLMQQACGSVTLASPLISFTKAVTKITHWELSDTTSYLRED
jgi:hypothetical protein